jgi:opacity protein-like surface antigen
MRKCVAVGILIFGLFLVAAAADDETPKAEVYGGVSFLHIDDNGLHAPKRNFAGWDAQFQYNITKLLGITADIGGNYGRIAPNVPNSHTYTYVFGPTFSFLRREHATVFAHALFGENTISDNIIPNGVCGAGCSTTDSAFAMLWGGGIDVKVNHTFAIRLAQLDWLYTRHDLTGLGGKAFQDNIRLTGGVVINLGSH